MKAILKYHGYTLMSSAHYKCSEVCLSRFSLYVERCFQNLKLVKERTRKCPSFQSAGGGCGSACAGCPARAEGREDTAPCLDMTCALPVLVTRHEPPRRQSHLTDSTAPRGREPTSSSLVRRLEALLAVVLGLCAIRNGGTRGPPSENLTIPKNSMLRYKSG